MSVFVQLLPDEYSKKGFAEFDPAAAEFEIGNARALMWLSQLAYETERPRTIQTVAARWEFSSVTPFMRHKIGLAGSFDTRGLIGERTDAVIMAFAGTDPGVWETLATDFNFDPTPDRNTHRGFQMAMDAVQPEIVHAIEMSRQANKPLFVTGHSLGGALAALAAQFAVSRGTPPKAVYVFGMPRTGGERFRTDYNNSLGTVTFRLVHGLDVVARVPSSSIGVPPLSVGFRHVGRVLQCDSGAKFDPSRLSEVGPDEPPFSDELAGTLRGGVEGILTGHVFSPPGPGPFGPFFRFLPQPIRDHLQDRYYLALTP